MTKIKRPLKVFLFHAPVDRVPVRDLYLRLIKDGVDAWLVKEKILPGQDWKQEIYRAVSEADVVVVCISGGFNQLESRQTEVWAAFDSVLKRLEGKVVVIPVRLEECDWPENLRNWQWADLFEETGYEMLMYALQAEADEIGAAVQAKEGSLPQITALSMKNEQSILEEEPVDVRRAILEPVEGAGVLIEGPAEKLQRPRPQRKLIGAVMLALIGLVGSMFIIMLPTPQFQRWYLLLFNSSWETTQTPTPTPKPEIRPVATPTLKPIPTLVSKGNVSHLVFLIDTSGSMQGQKIRMVRSALSEFVSRLGSDYFVSVIEFDTNVELRIAATRDLIAMSETINSISVDVEHNGSCIWDAFYAGVQQASLPPIAYNKEKMIILLTDVAMGEHVGWNCSIRFTEDLYNLTWNLPVPIYSIYVGDDFAANTFVIWIGGEGAIVSAKSEKKIESTLLSISQAAGLELDTDIVIQVPSTEVMPSMVFVPSGEFIMGSNRVSLDSFWIDKTEVTNAMYARCVQSGQCSPPRSSRSNTRPSYYGDPAYDNYPVVHISWVDAQNYCSWAGGRLPTEAEWEKAARGTDGRPFPWGDEDPSIGNGLLNYFSQDTIEVGSYRNGASPYGALDMAGNVSEWVADWLSLDYYNRPPASNPVGPDSGEYRVWRGGSWANTNLDSVRTDNRTGNLPTDSSGGIGFRCARDASP